MSYSLEGSLTTTNIYLIFCQPKAAIQMPLGLTPHRKIHFTLNKVLSIKKKIWQTKLQDLRMSAPASKLCIIWFYTVNYLCIFIYPGVEFNVINESTKVVTIATCKLQSGTWTTEFRLTTLKTTQSSTSEVGTKLLAFCALFVICC